jgi:uncharacterized protein involved in response to NO
VFAVVAHRMIPFFTASALPALDAWRPWWLMAVMLVTLAVEALGTAAEVLVVAAARGDERAAAAGHRAPPRC